MLASDANPGPVREQVERILASGGFARNDRLSGFLRFVVERELEGNRSALKESSIGVEVFDRKPGYDPKQDSIVRTEAAKLRTRLAQYYAGEGAGDPMVMELPKGGYVPAFRQIDNAANSVSKNTPRVPLSRAIVFGCLALCLAVASWWWAARRTEPSTIVQATGGDSEEAYRNGITLIRERSLNSVKRGADELRRVTQADPGFARAWAGLAEAAISLRPTDPEAGLEMARQAVAIDPGCGLCQGTLGFLLFSRQWKWHEAGERLKQAAQLAPDDPQIRYWVADREIALGRTSQALGIIDDAVRRLPHALNLQVLRALCLYMSRDFEGAVRAADKAIAVNLPSGWGWRGKALFLMGRHEEAVESQSFHLGAWSAASEEVVAKRTSAAVLRYREAGLQGPIGDLLKLTEGPAAAGVHAHNRARWYMLLGEHDEALRGLTAAVNGRLYDVIYLKVDPLFDPIRPRPEFREALRKVGFEP